MGYMIGTAGPAAGAWSLVVIVVAVVALIAVGRLGLVGGSRRRRSTQSHDTGADTPREILRRRYAAGEIREDEYLRILAGLPQR